MNRLWVGFCCGLTACTVLATQPPDPGALERYVQDGTYAARRQFIERIGKHRVRPDVARRTLSRLSLLSADGPAMAPLPNWEGMPTTGTNRVLILLVDFPDYNHVNDASVVTDKLFGDGNAQEFPVESLRSYYRRSSYGLLTIEGTALGWYRMQHPRNWYTTQYADRNEANRAVMAEAIHHFDPGHDYTQYDNNGDGEVDYFAVIWAGPDNGWGNFWWGYQWELNDPITADGVRFRTFSWQWESRPVGAEFTPDTIIHETGHALGLPDYYDYDPNVGPGGGVGGLDMMDAGQGDHNAFSKFMLEWLTPQVISGGRTSVVLRASADHPDAAALMPNYDGSTAYREYFLVQNRHRTENDRTLPSDGLLIWHVDARTNFRGDDFLYDNSYTPHKLLRLMEADGWEEIENGDGRADAGDYYNHGQVFGPDTNPNSRAYNGQATGVTVDEIPGDAPSMTVRCAVGGTGATRMLAARPAALAPSVAAGANAAVQTLEISAEGGALGYAVSDNATWLAVTPASGLSLGNWVRHTVTYTTADLAPGLYEAALRITSGSAGNSPFTVPVILSVMGGNLGDALDAPELTWTTGGDRPWFQQNSTTHDGIDAAQSGAIADDGVSWVQTTVAGPGTLQFWWKVSSEFAYDYLRLYVDGTVRPEALSGIAEWQPVSVPIEAGNHTVRWAYVKDKSLAAGADAAWLDQVSFVSGSVPASLLCTPTVLGRTTTVGTDPESQVLEIWNGGGGEMSYTVSDDAAWLTVTPPAEVSAGAHNLHTVSYAGAGLAEGTYSALVTIDAPGAAGSPKVVPVTLQVVSGYEPLAEAVDAPDLVWTTGGSAPWFSQATVTYDGEDAAQSGKLYGWDFSWLQTAVEGPGRLTFWWKASSEEGYDGCRVFVDGVDSGLWISGETDWRREALSVGDGAHTIAWEYSKDLTLSFGDDAVWLDRVEFTPTGQGQVTTVLEADFDSGLPAGWTVVDYLGGGAEWRFDDPGLRFNQTGGDGRFAIADTYFYLFEDMDTDLISPPMDLTGLTNVWLEFKTAFRILAGDAVAEVDMQIDGGPWTTLWEWSGANITGPASVQVDLSAAAGQKNVVFSFYYWNANFDGWWQVDDVRVTAEEGGGSGETGLTGAWWEVWNAFDEHYSYFEHKGIDWGPVYADHVDAFAALNDGAAFAQTLNGVLQVLHDWHVAVRRPDGAWLGYAGAVTNNYPSVLMTNYTGGVAYTNVRNANVLYHAWVAGDLAHVVVDTLNASAFAPITDGDLDAMFQRYEHAGGIILDLRANNGGDETNARRIAQRFTSLPRTYGYTRTRIPGANHDAFTPLAAKTLEPGTGASFTGRVACLIGQRVMSSGEWFALMMRACPQATLIGDRTRGATANPEEFTIPTLDVSYLVSRWIGYTADQTAFEDVGILPDIALAPGAASVDEAAGHDYVLEQAIALLVAPQLQLSVLPAGAGLQLSWQGRSGRWYSLETTGSLLGGGWTPAPGWTSHTPGQDQPLLYAIPAPGGFRLYRVRTEY